MTIYRSYWTGLLIFTIGLLTVACAAPTVPPAPPTPFVSPTQPPTATTQPPTPTLAPSATSEPATPTPPPTLTTEPPTATAEPTSTAEPATATLEPSPTTEAATATSSGGRPGKVNLDLIFPTGAGRELTLNNCTSCHSFVCVVRGQRTEEHWNTTKATHRGRVSSMNDADYAEVFAYLTEHFNDKNPEPELPPELAGLGCTGQ